MSTTEYIEKIDLFEERPRKIGRETLFISGLCLFIAVLLRAVSLGRRELFGDEFFGLEYATGPRPNLFEELFRGHTPLYYEILRGWVKLVGHGSDALLRLPSLVFAIAACIAFFFFAFRFLRGLAFVLALVGFALNPTLVHSAHEVSPYALVSLLVVLSHYYAIRALDEGQRRHWILWGLASVLGILAHPFFLFVILSQFLFALLRPRKTPRQFVILSAAGTFSIIALMVIGAVYAKKHFTGVNPDAPSLADLARGLVSVTLGEFYRYEYGDRLFLRATLYLFVFVSLLLSWVYYQLRQAEAGALPENVVWVDETQDVLGRWKRLSLASFLSYLWLGFVVPAVGIMVVGGFASGHFLPASYFVVCLPPMLVLIAAGIDAAPGRTGTIALAVLFVLFMSAYNYFELTDVGYGVKRVVERLEQSQFSKSTDAFLIVSPGGLRKPLKRYIDETPRRSEYAYTEIKPPAQPESCDAQMEAVTKDRKRIFVLYHDDFRRIGKSERSLVREWFGLRKNIWDSAKKWTLSNADKTEFRVYVRIDPSQPPPTD